MVVVGAQKDCVVTSWNAYLDESYNKDVFCVGSWLAPVGTWDGIERAWAQRLQFENRKSAQKGCPPISRYHATDCANLKNEFSERNGWNIERQIALSKKLCGIIERHRPIGIVNGGIVADLLKHWPELRSNGDYKRPLYYLGFITQLLEISMRMQLRFPGNQVSVFYDQSKELGPVAQTAYSQFLEDPSTRKVADCFVTCTPMKWQDCIPLQPADLIAYEGMKRIGGRIVGNDALRRALQAMLGKKTEIQIGYFEDQAFTTLKGMLERRPI